MVEQIKDFFPKIKPATSGQPEAEKVKKSGGVIDEANNLSKLPKRFAKTMLSASQTPFYNDIKSVATDNSDKTVILLGSTGTGKTSTLAGVIHERALNGLNPGLYFSMRLLPATVRSSRSFSARENEEELILRFSTVPCLFLDEIGTSEDVEMECNFIRTVYALRYDNMLPTWMAGNLSWDSFKEFISKNNPDNDPIADRLKANAIIKFFSGDSRRSM